MTHDPADYLLTPQDYTACKIAAHKLRRHEAAMKLIRLEGVEFKSSQRSALRDKVRYHTARIAAHVSGGGEGAAAAAPASNDP